MSGRGRLGATLTVLFPVVVVVIWARAAPERRVRLARMEVESRMVRRSFAITTNVKVMLISYG